MTNLSSLSSVTTSGLNLTKPYDDTFSLIRLRLLFCFIFPFSSSSSDRSNINAKSISSVKVSKRAGSQGPWPREQHQFFIKIFPAGSGSRSMDDNFANRAAVNICGSHACRDSVKYRAAIRTSCPVRN